MSRTVMIPIGVLFLFGAIPSITRYFGLDFPMTPKEELVIFLVGAGGSLVFTIMLYGVASWSSNLYRRECESLILNNKELLNMHSSLVSDLKKITDQHEVEARLRVSENLLKAFSQQRSTTGRDDDQNN